MKYATLHDRGMRRAAALLCLLAGTTSAADWPQYLGPNRSGISPETGLARSWPASGPRVLWRVPVGPGFGGAAVQSNEVFFLDYVPGSQDVLRCLDFSSGSEKWRYAYPDTAEMEWEGAQTVPTIEDDVAFVFGPAGHLCAVNRTTHQPVWSRNIVEEYRNRRPDYPPATAVPKWGVSQSPLVYKDTLIVAPHARDAGVVALDKRTGKTRWESPDIGLWRFSHVTPTLANLCGEDQIVMLANRDPYKNPPAIVSGVAALTGRLLWQTRTWQRYNVPIPSPVAVGPDTLFVAGGYTIGCFGLKVGRPTGTATNAHPWAVARPSTNAPWTVEYTFRENRNCTPHIQTPVFYGGRVYAQSFDSYHNQENNGLVCLDPDGRLRWKSGPDITFDNGNLIAADGLLFVLNGATGELCLVEASPDRYTPLAAAKILRARQGLVWTPMALSDGKLVLRDRDEMVCVDLRPP